jgi:hypothetical protein
VIDSRSRIFVSWGRIAMNVTTLTRFAFGFGLALGLREGLGTSPPMAQAAPTPSVTNLGTLGGGRSQGHGINTRRQVVG